ncbi:MAG TPA: glucan biosynthesis protein [Candidatus Binatia bacterium]|jgi:glucans biosynthesis protein
MTRPTLHFLRAFCPSRAAATWFFAAATLLAAPAAARAFSLDDVTTRAQALSKEEYVDHRHEVPKWMLVGSMTYDQWRDIRFNPDKALWKTDGLPFQVQMFHPGLYYDRTVAVNVIDDGGVHPVPFDIHSFDYGKNDFAAKIPPDIGYAGFRVHCQLRSQAYFDDLIVFLGATYFRALGRDNVYGLSARGIAINTVEPGGEEFPHFSEFWLEKPAPDAKSLVILALMEGPSIAGSYRFEITPGASTVIDVTSHLFPRRPVAKLGIAPLTSMFFFGEDSRRHFDDFRPEVHDSDGLLLHFDNGEWLWRPLDNPMRINASSSRMHNPRGFGLLQRDRAFADYQDLETHSEQRPSTWVQPHGDWGDGRVELDEIPSDSELVDNMVAYWVPDTAVQPGQQLDFAYSVSFYTDDPAVPPGGRIIATRQDSGAKGDTKRFVIDFAGEDLNAIPDASPPTAVITTPPPEVAELLDHHVLRNPDTGGWRLAFQIKPKTDAPIELRAFLRDDKGALTETWSWAVVH